MKFGCILAALLALANIPIARAEAIHSPAADPGTNAAAKTTGPVFDVRGYRIEGNTVLPPEDFLLLTNYTGAAVDLATLRLGLSELQLLYRNLGYATIGVTLPQQRLTNGYVRVRIVEGRLGNITVQGNRHFSSDNVLRALPSLETNVLLNTKWFQPELDRANANQDRQIYPVVSPGLDPGTTDLTLKVKDRLPLHSHIEINDKAPPGTPLLRVDSAIEYNNLWQLEHQVGFQYSFTPQEMKADDYAPNILEQPMVSSYSGFYRIPINTSQGLRESYDRLPVNFGYDEVTHKFNLPPATGNPELIFFASRSVSDSVPNLGAITPVTNGPAFDINSQFASRTLAFNNDLGFKFTVPLREFSGLRSAVSFGLDYKSYKAENFNTNLTYFDLFSLDTFGNRTLVTNTTTATAFNSTNELHYLPISFGWTGTRPDKTGATSFYWNQNVFFTSLASARTNFQAVAQSPQAGGQYTTANFGLTRDQQLPRDWSLQLRANGQWASAPLISNEQFGLGGTTGVRGYREGEAYGDTGWRTLFDLRAPAINVGYFPGRPEDIPASLRCSWFMDYGESYHLDSAAKTVRQWGTGVGFYLTASEHFDARLTLAWALRDSPMTRAGNALGYFSLGFQF